MALVEERIIISFIPDRLWVRIRKIILSRLTQDELLELQWPILAESTEINFGNACLTYLTRQWALGNWNWRLGINENTDAKKHFIDGGKKICQLAGKLCTQTNAVLDLEFGIVTPGLTLPSPFEEIYLSRHSTVAWQTWLNTLVVSRRCRDLKNTEDVQKPGVLFARP